MAALSSAIASAAKPFPRPLQCRSCKTQTAWRVMSHRQAAHLFIRVLGVLGGEPPGGTFPAARRRFGVTLNFWVADEAPGGTG
ncbi:hypothetical protein DEO72_LG5g1376 [Vigna unguiculata]|uniref:Uncharacterized protein n=1 Tax=Vigna unguiculata TaxID=3917 RepID=A0A4D6LXU3_VIGUN|nr:hypothetical protein DEO72_LG5g1376 [Vigna unguiculata]